MSTPAASTPAAAKPTTPKQYLDTLPEDRRKSVQAIRKTINAHLGKGFKEGIQYGMIGWFVPHSVYPKGYHCDPAQPLPFASVASQKNHIGIYLFCLYTDEAEQDRFVKAWKATGKRLDMGKSCIRVKSADDVPMEVLGEAIARMDSEKFIAVYESRWGASKTGAGKTGSKKQAAKKPAGKKKASKKTVSKKTVSKKTAKKAVSKKPAAKKPAAKKPAAKKKVAKKAVSKKTGSKKIAARK